MDIDLESPPPCYSESSASSSSLPRAYLPREFSVGKFKTQPIVTVEDLQAHLRVLGAFSKLKEDVHHMNGASQKEKDQAWVVYVSRAVHRFNTFMGAEWEGGFPGWTEENTPPLDVLMVLHSYLLNPFAYYEDSIRRTTFFSKNLTNLGCFPLHLIASLIDPETLDAYPPSTEREDYFAKHINDPFICPLITSTSDILSLPCPCCDKMAPKIPWITKDQKGFAQPFFAFTCRSCGKEFTKSMMGIRRFANEVTKKRARRKVHLSETLLDPKTGQPDPTMASMITVSLLRRLNSKFSLYVPCKEEEIDSAARQLAAGLKWSTEVLVEYLQSGLEPKIEFNRLRILPRVARIAAAYTTTGPASIDLVGTVLRQSFFISKMSDMGWSKPGKIPPNQEAANLARAVVRYHAFLDLQSQSTYKLLVPTLVC
ncbi:hypothetical protein CPB86DRAFT_222091 [Serendipita vermifera]|nr:hypothetical protein CPB86DRAFT_222091 [Serendipita vermifera]